MLAVQKLEGNRKAPHHWEAHLFAVNRSPFCPRLNVRAVATWLTCYPGVSLNFSPSLQSDSGSAYPLPLYSAKKGGLVAVTAC